MTFEIVAMKGDQAHTVPKKFAMTPASIKRLVRRGVTRIDDSFICLTKDGVPVRLKPFLLTRTECVNSIGTNLRMNARAFISEAVKSRDFDTLVNDIISKKLLREMSVILSKIYPLKICEMRSLVKEPTRKEAAIKEIVIKKAEEKEEPVVEEETVLETADSIEAEE